MSADKRGVSISLVIFNKFVLDCWCFFDIVSKCIVEYFVFHFVIGCFFLRVLRQISLLFFVLFVLILPRLLRCCCKRVGVLCLIV